LGLTWDYADLVVHRFCRGHISRDVNTVCICQADNRAFLTVKAARFGIARPARLG
jgi:hypothetical protein